MSGECLILSNDEATRAEWVAMVTRRGFTPLRVVGVPDALRHLHERHVAAALVDCPADDAADVAHLLKVMAHDAPAVEVFVRADYGDVAITGAITTAHPGSAQCDRRLGAGAAGPWLSARLGRRIGDLVVEQGVVIHEPTGQRWSHPLAVRLVGGAPGMVHAHRVGADAEEISRFRRWLREVGSVVQVRNQRGKGLYWAEVVRGQVTSPTGSKR